MLFQFGSRPSIGTSAAYPTDETPGSWASLAAIGKQITYFQLVRGIK